MSLKCINLFLKSLALSVEEETRDLQSVESCQRKLEATERDMTAIESKLKVCFLQSVFYCYIKYLKIVKCDC